MSNNLGAQGALFVVATPIGNLEDMSPRARRVLSEVDVIAAEDTRHSAPMLRHFQISTPLTAFHEHNEQSMTPELIRRLQGGQRIALISDAGTPLVNDPGFKLVRAARAAGISVVPVPGPCAAIVALSAAGLPSDRFAFEGFPPARTAARRAYFDELREDTRTLIFYESPHRVAECLADMVSVIGADREAVLARELTKQFETIRAGTLGELCEWVKNDSNQQRGELVLLVHGKLTTFQQEIDGRSEKVLRILLAELPIKQAAALAAQITGIKKNRLYDHALGLAERGR